MVNKHFWYKVIIILGLFNIISYDYDNVILHFIDGCSFPSLFNCCSKYFDIPLENVISLKALRKQYISNNMNFQFKNPTDDFKRLR